ncbi:MAG: glycerol-3-phosphate dehydrogenase/oxidase [bacterium]|nr:glycerol-3-phosphate dehydrogenase/oxidase [bacterium]
MRRDAEQLRRGPFDLLVIGGGIYGAWTAYDAALRGLKVAVVDKGDWASGTSSASSKLIHGGLRYLEQFRLGLVKKSLEERKRLTALAPHRVTALRFLIPVYKNSSVGPLRLRAGLALYDLLAGRGQPVARHGHLTRRQVEKKYPFLRVRGLKTVLTYGDCQMDDFRFVLEIIRGAFDAGAVTVNYARASELLVQGDRVVGAMVTDEITKANIPVTATVVVNTAGPWIPEVSGPVSREPMIRLTKGVHLVMPPLPTRDAMLVMIKRDKRIFFILPWYGKTLLGTTDTDYEGHPDDVRVEEHDMDYLLNEANQIFREAPWDRGAIQGAFAGLRALQNEPGKSPSAVTRKWSVAEPRKHLLVSVGGKYTSARADAGILVDRVMAVLGRRPWKEPPTATLPFPWSPGMPFSQWRRQTVEIGRGLGLDAEAAESATYRYGTEIEKIFQRIRQHRELANLVVPGLPFTKAEIVHGAAVEMAVHLEDLLRRRVPLLILSPVTRQTLVDVANLAAPVMGWSPEQCREEVNATASRWQIR